MDVVTARSGDEGMAQMESFSVDLLISDVRMPGMGGEEVVKETGKRCPGLPVILITGKGDIQSAVSAMKLGAFDYVIKPPEETEFRLTVERAIEHGRLRRENEFLRTELAAGGMYGERLIGRSDAMLAVFDLINRVAPTDSTVLITGETGTGKELVAQTLHYKSNRAKAPLVAVNCAALNPNLIESELFGHEKGAFTGATTARRGRFEDADGGTLFLDEIGEISIDLQAKLLRALQEAEIRHVGGSTTIPVDVRLLTSTNRDLKQAIEDGTFREDLYYRLCVIPIRIPSLREHKNDIPLLAAHFKTDYARRYGIAARAISETGMSHLQAQEWKGNVRELQHCVERAVVLSRSDILGPDDFREVETGTSTTTSTDDTLQCVLDQHTRQHLISILDKTGWRKQQAAKLLGIDRVTLYRMLKKFSIDRGSS